MQGVLNSKEDVDKLPSGCVIIEYILTVSSSTGVVIGFDSTVLVVVAGLIVSSRVYHG